jgi:D-amino-acid oxidase
MTATAGVAATVLAATVLAAAVLVALAVLRRHRLPRLRIDGPLVVVPLHHPARPEIDHDERRDRQRNQSDSDCDAHSPCLLVSARPAYAGRVSLTTGDRPRRTAGAVRYGAGVSTASPDVLVIGAGVCGLSTAIVLLDAGLAVEVYAADPPHRTTSAAAGALWGPHLVGSDQRVGPWAARTLDRFRALAAEPAAGITEMPGLVAASRRPDHHTAEPPPFTTGAGPAAGVRPADLPDGFATGWRYAAPVVDMPAYLDYLLTGLLARAGQLRLGPPLRTLAEAQDLSTAPVIVNCTGIGAAGLVPDAGLRPVRGQVVIVANPGLTEFFVGEREDPAEVTYIFPHGPVAVLGGTQQHGDASLRPGQGTADKIVAACAAVEPRLAEAQVIGHRVGLRPVRAMVRLETQALRGKRFLVHNYGHGGAGVTLSWGCADAVQAEIAAIFGR